MSLPNQVQQNPISIVIPTYNRLKTLKQVIDSYTSQSQVREIIVVDDFGTDGTKEFILDRQQKDPRIIYTRNDKNLGSPTSRNIGVAKASGEFIVFGEDDLRFGPDYAAKLMDCLERNGGSVAAGRIVFPFPGETDTEAIRRSEASKSSERIDKRKIFYDASTPAPHDIQVPFIHAISMVRKEVFETVRFDPSYRGNAYREETDFYLRVGQSGHKIFFCPDAVCVHLAREVQNLGGQMSRGIWTHKYWSLRNNYLFLQRHYRYLKEHNLVEDGFVTLLVSFAAAELMKIPTFYLRKYSPTAYTALAKRLVR